MYQLEPNQPREVQPRNNQSRTLQPENANPALSVSDRSATSDACQVSIVVPIYNELENVELMHREISAVMTQNSLDYEIICVDDGSRDGTVDLLRRLAAEDWRLKLVLFRRNYGQTAAMQAGIDYARGRYIVTMDGDLQNDPADIPMMLEKLDEGFDLVHGWRKDRKDALLSRKIPSRIANWIISRTTGFPINDLGCTLKAMRAEIAKEMELFGEMHRFIPVLAHQLGARCVEVVTRHRARQFGTTKYGIGRTFRVVLDLLTVNFLIKHIASPMKLFGKLGLRVAGFAILCLVSTVAMKLFAGTDMTGNPLLLAGILGAILSVQFFSLGLIGEVSSRIYYSSTGRRNYTVRHRVNFSGQAGPDKPKVSPMSPMPSASQIPQFMPIHRDAA